MNLMRNLLLLLLILTPAVQAAEYIESFHSDIEISKNGDLVVTETIVVRAEGKSIKRGIFRDFPTRYQDDRGRDVVVGFEVLSVSRDGINEPYHIKNRSNGKRVFIGDANIFLDPGFYEYRLSYLTTRQLGFFEDFDELYWNVTGTGWSFEIGKASALVQLPDTVTDFQLTGYTGKQGSTAQNLNHRREDSRSVYFETTEPLGRYEGLTIVAGWPKGLIEPPSAAQQRQWFIEENRSSLIVGIGALALLIYYSLMWRWVGKDPQAGILMPHYKPPAGYSPASMRFIQEMGYDKKCFTTAIINLAVKGAVEIDADDEDGFRVIKTGPARKSLAAGEQEVLTGLFEASRREISIEQGNHPILSKAIKKHWKSLKADYQKKYFNTNRWLLVPAWLASLALIGLSIAYLPSEEVVMKTIFFCLFLFIPLMVVYRSIQAVMRRGRKGIARWGIFLVPLIVLVGFFFIGGFPFAEFAEVVQIPQVIAVAVILVMNYCFFDWMSAPTLSGRKLLDKIDGFKHYLKVAEEDEIAATKEPEFTTDIYEAYLPYAIALDLENEWTAKLDAAVRSGSVDAGYSRPHWYHSRSSSRAHFSSALASSFDSAISSSSVAPGSSSGSSGGSSGGGGGGGGGGGW